MNCLPHTEREGRSPERSPATARQLECELYSVPLSRAALGKASKAPGDRGAGLQGHTGTRHSVREWSSRADATAQGHWQTVQLPERGLGESGFRAGPSGRCPPQAPADGTFYILRSNNRALQKGGRRQSQAGLAPRPRCRAPAVCGPLQGKAGPGAGSQMPGGTFLAMDSHPAPFLQELLGDIAHG